MNRRHGSFTYRNEGSVQAFGSKENTLLVATPGKLVEWDRTRRRVAKEVPVDMEVTDVKDFNGHWVLLSKSSVGLLSGSKVEEVTTKGPLDASVVYRDRFLLVGDKEITVIAAMEESVEVRRTRLASDNGVCTCGVAATNKLFLSFENGKVFVVEEPKVTEILAGRASEMRMDEFQCLIFLKEPIVSINLLGDVLVVSLFNKKVLALSLETKEASFTELLYDIKASATWNNLIVVCDSRNNVIFLTQGLEVTYGNCLKEEICNILTDGPRLIIGFKVGVVKEYEGDDGAWAELACGVPR
ncbi:hypothetical protein [Encephalitozoon cuniculi GB-M1]|uniref:Uncharacterized protein n=1 Tax=Encephalitozoon cuniculi (strain GB-M1) TaxID=284813 RepID=Q8SVA3_ENCCU|nr:uncharacterized protein ECU06_0970 [Encephalitozoon cuniculi GB-M1]CAD25457.1 hypothetical protein [Encephalitozoon cuniculi GB-M1]